MTFSKNQTHENQTLKCDGAITESEFLKDLPSLWIMIDEQEIMA